MRPGLAVPVQLNSPSGGTDPCPAALLIALVLVGGGQVDKFMVFRRACRRFSFLRRLFWS